MQKKKKQQKIPFYLLLIGITIFISLNLFFQLENKEETNFNSPPLPSNNNSRTITNSPSPPSSPIPTQTPTPTSFIPELIPDKKVLSGGKQVFQTFNNCGPASLSMLLSYFDINISQQKLGYELRPYQHAKGNNDDKSVTLAELAARAEELGLSAYHRPAGDIEMLQNFISQNIPVLTRTWLNSEEDIGHYRVIKGYNKKKEKIIQDDSYQGKNRAYSYIEFNELWQAFNFEFLVLVPPEKNDLAEQILGKRKDQASAWLQALDYAQKKTGTSANIYNQFNRLRAHYHLGNYQETVKIFETIQNRLSRRMLWYQIEPVLAYYQLDNFDKVLEISQAIFNSQNKAFSELHYLRGIIFQKQGQDTKAEEAFRLAHLYNSANYWKINLPNVLRE